MSDYDRRTAARNGEMFITRGGRIAFKKYMHLPPRFDGAYLDTAIQKHGRDALDRVLREVLKVMASTGWGRPPSLKVTDASAGQDPNLYIAAEAKWVASEDYDGPAIAAALESVAGRMGVSVENAVG